jgi:hypothetical protein
MDIRFFKAAPDANVQFPSMPNDGSEPDFVVVALENTLDPDANNHTGFDYFGAYGVGDDIDAWAGGQPVTAITKTQLPNPVTFYPAPFNEA